MPVRCSIQSAVTSRRAPISAFVTTLGGTHIPVPSTCDRIIVLQGGRLVEAGDVGRFTSETETVFLEIDSNRGELVTA